MTETQRIFWNIFATYGRSLYGLVLGLFCGRWALMALGEIDYGLMGLVGGLTVFITFINNVLASANARFYAFSIGAANVAKDKSGALEECRKWFNTAFSVHLVVPCILICIGYPIGVYAIKHWLTIPAGRIFACIWVFRFVCVSCFITMVNVPFHAMYTAKQYIAELTIYSFITSTLNAIVLGYMVSYPSVWLIKFAAWTCFLSVTPQIIICIRANYIFPECKLNIRYMWNKAYLKRLGCFSGWQMIGIFCGMLRTQGISIVINKFFGAAMNAAQAIGNTVQGHCNTLAGSMQAAFVPVITQACGARDCEKMNKFAIRLGKFNVVLSMIFMVPLALELPKVMELWLKRPPTYSVGLCYFAMIFYLVDCCTVGHMVAINANGKIALYQSVINFVSIVTIPLAIVFAIIWQNVYAVMTAVIIIATFVSLIRIALARILINTSVRIWVFEVFIPLVFASVICVSIGWIPHLVMSESFLRIVITTVVYESIYLPITWFALMSQEEREFVLLRILPKVKHIFGR